MLSDFWSWVIRDGVGSAGLLRCLPLEPEEAQTGSYAHELRPLANSLHQLPGKWVNEPLDGSRIEPLDLLAEAPKHWWICGALSEFLTQRIHDGNKWLFMPIRFWGIWYAPTVIRTSPLCLANSYFTSALIWNGSLNKTRLGP